MRKISIMCLVCCMIVGFVGLAHAATVNFTADDVKNYMNTAGDPLSDASYQWGLWAVRAMPVVGGNGIYTITSGSTSQTGWGASAPGAFGSSPYTATNSVWFWDASGAEAAGTPSNPLYMVMDQPQDNFQSNSFNGTGTGGWVGSYSPGGGGTFYASGYNGGVGGTNLVTAVSDSSAYSFSFALDPGATWSGQWQFVVDGSKFTKGTYASPGVWQANFFGGYGTGGDLSSNMGAGYLAPEPVSSTLFLVGAATLGFRRFCKKRKI